MPTTGDRWAIRRRCLVDERQPSADDQWSTEEGRLDGDEWPLAGVGTRHAGPRQRVVVRGVETKHITGLDGNELVDG